jgi:hypothetical protein
MDMKKLAMLAELSSIALHEERETLFGELMEMVRDQDHSTTIEAKVFALGIVEAAAHIADALDRGLNGMVD